jgi:hypothetical protein
MNKPKHFLLAIGLLMLAFSSCKKDDEVCGIKSGSGVQASNQKNVMFWIDHDMQLGQLKIDRLINRKTGLAESSRGEWIITNYFNSQPECGTSGAATFLLTKGYEYDYYVYGETGDTLTGRITVDCSDDCQAYLIQ